MKIILALTIFSSVSFAAPNLTTIAEKSDWKQTGRADETERLCHTFAQSYPSRIKCKSLGKTPEGRNLWAMTVGKTTDPVVWVQAGIHAGEIDGKDAVFWLLKDILTQKVKQDPLKGICLVFIPIMNLDGHERFGKFNRPNQVGPEEMGWRVTSQNYNLNRDYLKVDAPEMRMITKFWREVDPVLSLDLHVTDGAKFQPEVGLIILPNKAHGTSDFHKAGSEFETEIVAIMNLRGHSALPFYPSFEEEDDPKTGFSRYVALPRFSQSYWYHRNRLGMLVETHSWKDYATRVKTHYNTVLASLELAQKDALKWKEIYKEIDSADISGKPVALEFKHTDKVTELTFPGYEYKKIKSPISNSEVIAYDDTKKQDWKVPFYEELVPALEVTAPAKGYFVSASDASIVTPVLDAHGIKYSVWKQPIPKDLHVFRTTKTELSPKSFEGHQTMKVTGQWRLEPVTMAPNPIFVPINQKAPKIILHLFEPVAQDSLLSWGFFNRYFEQKEYMENYVTHEVGLEMLESPEIRAEFENELKKPEFRDNPAARFEFFSRKHQSWDDRLNRYPVFKL